MSEFEPSGNPSGSPVPPSQEPGPSIPSNPASPPSPATTREGADAPAVPSSGLPPNLAAAIAELLPLLGGIIFYAMDRKHGLVRFHAMQSIYFGAALVILSVILTVVGLIPVLGWLFALIVAPIATIVLFVVWVIAVFKAFNGVEWEIPVIGKLVKQQLAAPQS